MKPTMTMITVYEKHYGGGSYWVVQQEFPDGSRSSRSYGNDQAAAEAAYDVIMAGPRCVECGDPQVWGWNADCEAAMRAQQVCLTCLSWRGRLADDAKHPEAVVIVKGHHFTISPDKPKGYQGFIGHGGAEFVIKFHDGREVVSHNLWAQGGVPEHFKTRFPDNAVFVEKRSVCKGGPVGIRNGVGDYVGAGSGHFVD